MRLLAVVLALGMVTLVVLAATGRAKVRGCCSVPVEHDLRMRDPSAAGNS